MGVPAKLAPSNRAAPRKVARSNQAVPAKLAPLNQAAPKKVAPPNEAVSAKLALSNWAAPMKVAFEKSAALTDVRNRSKWTRVAPVRSRLMSGQKVFFGEAWAVSRILDRSSGWSGRDGRRGAVVGERFERCAVAERGMQSSAVVEDLDVFGDGEPRPGSASEGLPVVHLILQGGEE
jgi:hypothetical protein